MVSLHYAINSLDRVARSTRMFRFFSRDFELKIVTLPKLEVVLELPTDTDSWRLVLDKAMLRAARTAAPASETLLQQAVDRFSAPSSRPSPVHCELSIIEHFATPCTPSPTNYIGMSKLSCAACTALVEQWNAMSAARLAAAAWPSFAPSTALTQFDTNGCNRKWYSVWGFPKSANMQPILDSVYGRFSEAFGEQMHKAGYAD